MQKKDNIITIITDDGKEINCEILFTFSSAEFNHEYVVFQSPNDEYASAAIFHVGENGNGTLEKIESDEEWEFVFDVFDQYINGEDEGCSGKCEGCNKNCNGEDCDCA